MCKNSSFQYAGKHIRILPSDQGDGVVKLIMIVLYTIDIWVFGRNQDLAIDSLFTVLEWLNN